MAISENVKKAIEAILALSEKEREEMQEILETLIK